MPLKSVLGCCRFGWIRSMSSIRKPASPFSTTGSGMRLLSPLPSACLFMTADHLAGQVEIRLGSLGTDIVEHDRLAEARRLPQTDVARNDRLVDLLLEE